MTTRAQANLLAQLARTIRPSWDELHATDVIAAVNLLEINADLADLAHAVIRCAENRTMRTPGAIALTDADHWRPTVRDKETAEEARAQFAQQLAERREARREAALAVTATGRSAEHIRAAREAVIQAQERAHAEAARRAERELSSSEEGKS